MEAAQQYYIAERSTLCPVCDTLAVQTYQIDPSTGAPTVEEGAPWRYDPRKRPWYIQAKVISVGNV